MTLAPEALERELFRILDLLADEDIEHFLTGAQVRNLFAEPRTSGDFDIVVLLRGRPKRSVRELFEANGYSVEGPLKGDLGERFVLGLPDFEADIWLAPDTEFHRSEFGNAVRVPYGGRELPVMAPGDYVLRKLVNYYRVRGKSNDLEDAFQVLLHAWERIDVEGLPKRAEVYRIRKQAEALIEKTRRERVRLEG
ncbi:MAG: hypothetical protein ACT4PT_01345 [Methanobacteriota archaeon]